MEGARKLSRDYFLPILLFVDFNVNNSEISTQGRGTEAGWQVGPFINNFAPEIHKQSNGSSLANKSTSAILMHDFVPSLWGP